MSDEDPSSTSRLRRDAPADAIATADTHEPGETGGSPRAQVIPLNRPSEPPVVAFDRHELRQIMNVYGRKVAEGEWRDYALDFTPQHAVFSIYRRTSEVPLYRIEKDPKLARKQGAYSVIAPGGRILKRGHELERVIDVLEKKVKLVVS